MKRQTVLLAVLAAILVVTLFWLLAYQPSRTELAEVQEQIAAQQQQQLQLESELRRLQDVRLDAPGAEAALAAAEAVIPRDAALPAALRQLQVAADESGAVLRSVSTGRPAQVEGGTEGLSAISVNVELLGGYFQVVDFLRRIEDPAISPRGLRWASVTVAKDEHPTLAANLSGDVFTMLPSAPPPPPVGEPTEDESELETEAEADA
jgi:Tfp pilus assembly protein PilO